MVKKIGVASALLLFLCGSALGAEITFQSFEVDVGQDGGGDWPIVGNEWLGFGIDMSGTELFVYGATDPFPLPDNKNGVFEATGPSQEIVFTTPVTDLEVSWWSPFSDPVTITAYDEGGAVLQVETHTGEEFGTDLFGGSVKRLVIDAPPFTLCVANLKFNATQVPMSSAWSLTLTFVLLAIGIAGIVAWRWRVSTPRV